MKNYKINFEGRRLGAIGKFQMFTEDIKAENLAAAKLKLYDTHEHIRVIRVNGEPYDYKKFSDKNYNESEI